jgi:hypothetical protein
MVRMEGRGVSPLRYENSALTLLREKLRWLACVDAVAEFVLDAEEEGFVSASLSESLV